MTDTPLDLSDLNEISVTRLNGVGEKKAKGLAASEIHTLLDLLTYYPRRYLDRTKEAKIAELFEGDEASVLVTVDKTSSPSRPGRQADGDVDGERFERHTADLVLQSGVAGAAANAWPSGHDLRQGRHSSGVSDR